MIAELNALRALFGRFLIVLFWGHVPVLALVAWLNGMSPMIAAMAGALLAGAYHLTWWRNGIAPATRYLSAVALMAEPAVLLLLLRGHPWQMDMHMYFFAMLALTIAWCDRRAILVAATAVALHHLLLLYLLPVAVFPAQGNLERVLFHAAIVAFQTAALVWLSNLLVASFRRIDSMRGEILLQNEALEERTLEAENASKAKSMFLANMSHEIRTPMNAILGFCHLVARTDLNGKQRDYITKINGSAVSLLRLINDILDFSKGEAGKLAMELRPFDLRSAVASQVQLVSGDAKAKGVRIVSLISPALPHVVVGDELRINQVLLNLLSNAVKFSRDSEVEVTIGVEEADADHVMIEMAVRDHGIGIPAEDQARLFNSFTQADSSTTRRFGGTGLGLAICRQILEQMDGSIHVGSAPGRGSTFTCRFRLALKNELDRRPVVELPDHVRELCILAADDNPAARQIVEEIFAQWGMPIDLVASGEEVLAACRVATDRGRPYDLVMLDWKMPGMDGMETIRALHQTVQTSPLPVTLIVTAYGTDDLVSQTGELGISAFLLKPVEPDALLSTLLTLFPEPGSVATTQGTPDGLPLLASHLRGSRVLLVEDNEINREIAFELLTDAGLAVDWAENGRVACERMEADGGCYAAVLMDVQMPEMDGIEATRIIRRTWRQDRLPIIAMTAHAFEEERQRCFEAGMNDHVAKPIAPPLLIDTLNRWLRPVDVAIAPATSKMPEPKCSGLPAQLPPFDIPAALRRVNGKKALLRKLILDFAGTYAGVVGELRVHISTGLLPDARRLAHTLKGVGGSLELGGLQEAAAIVEKLLAIGEADQAIAALDDLERALIPAIEAARSLAGGDSEQSQEAASIIVDPVGLKLAQERLRELVARRSLGARSAFDALADAIGLSAAERVAHPLHQSLQKLDYGAALTWIDGQIQAETAQ